MDKQPIVTLNAGQLRLIVAEAVNEAVAKQKQTPQLMRSKDVMRLFQITYNTFKNWLSEGLLPHYKVRNRLYFKPDDVMKALELYAVKERETKHRKAA